MAQRALDEVPFEELYRQIENLPEGMTGEILVPGVLETMSRPGADHRRAVQRIFRELGGIDEGTGGQGWWIELDVEIRMLRRRLFVPDLSGWRVERCPARPTANPIEIVPDWVCEVHSDSTRKKDRHLKLPLYCEAGVPWIWLVDPVERLVEVYVPHEGQPKLVASAADDEAPSLPPFGLPITLTPWWSDPPIEPTP